MTQPRTASAYWAQRRADDRKNRIGRGAPASTGDVFRAPTNIERARHTVPA